MTTRWSEYYGMSFCKYGTALRERMGDEAKGCIFVGPRELFCRKAFDEMVGNGRENMEGQRPGQSWTKKSTE